MIALSPHQEEVLRHILDGEAPRDVATSVTLSRIYDKLGVCGQEDGYWRMRVEMLAWVIQYRPDLIPNGSPLFKALEARGLECRKFERIGREVARVITEELR